MWSQQDTTFIKDAWKSEMQNAKSPCNDDDNDDVISPIFNPLPLSLSLSLSLNLRSPAPQKDWLQRNTHHSIYNWHVLVHLYIKPTSNQSMFLLITQEFDNKISSLWTYIYFQLKSCKELYLLEQRAQTLH